MKNKFAHSAVAFGILLSLASCAYSRGSSYTKPPSTPTYISVPGGSPSGNPSSYTPHASFTDTSLMHETTLPQDTSKKSQKRTKKDTPILFAEKMLLFPGGDEELYKFIIKNMKYPEISQQNNVSGQVIAQFVVTKKGRIIDPIILKGIDEECDKEVLRMISLMPNWIPGEQKGKKVPVFVRIPVKFDLSSYK